MNKFFAILKKYSKILFTVYVVFLILVIVLKFPTGMVRNMVQGWFDGQEVVRMSPQMIPFKTIIEYAGNVHSLNDWFIKNLMANVIMFIPYGFLVPFFAQKDRKVLIKVVLTGCTLSIFIEVFQYVTALGQCDVDDVILNTLGVLLGGCIYQLIYLFVQKSNGK